MQPYGQGLTIGATGGEDPGTPGVSGEPSETSHTEHQPLMSEMQDEQHEASSPTVCLQSGGVGDPHKRQETHVLQNCIHVMGTF